MLQHKLTEEAVAEVTRLLSLFDFDNVFGSAEYRAGYKQAMADFISNFDLIVKGNNRA